MLPHPATLHAQLRFAQASCRLFVFVGGEMLPRAGWQHSVHKLPGTSTPKWELGLGQSTPAATNIPWYQHCIPEPLPKQMQSLSGLCLASSCF